MRKSNIGAANHGAQTLVPEELGSIVGGNEVLDTIAGIMPQINNNGNRNDVKTNSTNDANNDAHNTDSFKYRDGDLNTDNTANSGNKVNSGNKTNSGNDYYND
jgi:hypothetical protein